MIVEQTNRMNEWLLEKELLNKRKKDRKMNEWMNERTNERTDGRVVGRTDGRTDERTNEWINDRMSKWQNEWPKGKRKTNNSRGVTEQIILAMLFKNWITFTF